MSVQALLEELAARGLELQVEPGGRLRYRGPRGAMNDELREALRRSREEVLAALAHRAPAAPPGRSPAEERFAPFPLTPLEEAYWLGEKEFYDQRTPAFFSQEYRLPELDLPSFVAALARVVAHHDVLRLRIGEDGLQSIAREAPSLPIRVEDLRALPAAAAVATAEVAARIAARREALEDELPPLAAGPPFAFAVQLLPGGVHLHVALRLIAFDALSTHTFYADVAGCYRDPGFPLRPNPLSFRGYCLSLEAHRQSEEYRRAAAYWQERVATLPPAPDLPRLPRPPRLPRLSDAPGRETRRVFRRLTTRLSESGWQSLVGRTRQRGLTMSTVLCALFAETVRRWSASRDFTLNVLISRRPAGDPGYARMIGNSSTTLLLQADAASGSFAARVAALQRRLYADLEHAAVAGVEVIRQLQQRGQAGEQPRMPVVFTSALDLADDDQGFHFPLPGAILVHSALKTPQVWLDQQVYLESGGLVCNWDFLPDVFPPGMVEAMQHQHRRHLEALTASDDAWEAAFAFPLSGEELAERRRSNSMAATVATAARAASLEVGLLHSFLHRSAGESGRPALIDDAAGVEIGYGELAALARRTAWRLVESGVRPGDLVGVLAAKGWRQLAAVLAVLEAGAAYLPLDARLPPARVAQLVAASGVRIVLTDLPARLPAGCPALPLPERAGASPASERGAVPLPALPLDSLAYVIYTSGSTGEPKGVAIGHRGAVHTILDVLARCGIGESDRVLALSALGFDLSVFDLFGALAAGGTVVVPREAEPPDPGAWADAVARHGVTVWNSVPALLEMALDFLGESAVHHLSSLRVILLSGDWLPLPLVQRVRRLLPEVRLYSLGGATEASIWSNFHYVDALLPGWNSVPYGRPLARQSLRILDPDRDPVPTWAVGELYIGGLGVARGYWADPERTALSFVPDPDGEGRLYRTGDLARYRPGGIVEFLGRRDHQVKIRGFRIELGEIEVALLAHTAVREAVVLVHPTAGGERELAAFVTAVAEAAGDLGAALRLHLAERLPAYMVPSILSVLADFPLTANGKVDRQALSARLLHPGPTGTSRRPPATRVERRLAALWEKTLGVAIDSVEDDFFARGGSSLLAVRLFRGISDELGQTLPLASLFQHSTLASQARLLEGEREGEDGER